MNSRNYKAWEIDKNNLLSSIKKIEKVKLLTNFGYLAPSVHNSQPWIVDYDQDCISIKPDYRKSLPIADPNNNYIFLSIGAFVENVLIAAEYAGFEVNVKYSNISVNILIGNQNKHNSNKSELINFITKRFSNKKEYTNKQISNSIISEVVKKIDIPKSKTLIITDKNTVNKISKVHVLSAKKSLRNAKFIRELSSYLRFNKTKKDEGMPGFVMGVSNLKSLVGPYVLRIFPKLIKPMEKSESEKMKSTHAFGLILVKGLEKEAYFNAGRAYQLVSLMLLEKSIHNQLLTSSVLIDESKSKLSEIIKNDKNDIKLLFRVGYPKFTETLHTPRRKI